MRYLSLILVLALSFLISQCGASQRSDQQATTVVPRSTPDNLPVCWEDQGFEVEKEWVKEALTREYVSRGFLNLTGFFDCSPEVAFSGIRIAIADLPPHVKELGVQALRGLKDGIVLNMTFKRDNRSCQNNRKDCITGMAVHEFGHVAGLPDVAIPVASATATCTQGQFHQASFRSYSLQADSVMNYCNPNWMSGQLSESDIEILRSN